MKTDDGTPRVLLCLAVATVLAAIGLAFTSADPLFLAPFRESQTAISARYLVDEPQSGWLNYQLPVFGYPWQIPHEFPLFQIVTSWINQAGVELVLAGRILSLVGWLACMAASCAIWSELGLPKSRRGLLIVLLVCAPVHAAYATSHMIESWALGLALWSMWAGLRHLDRGGPWWEVGSLCLGVLAAAVKITTWLPVGAVIGLSILGSTIRRQRTAFGFFRGCVTLVLVPLFAGVLWTKWAGDVRNLNPIAASFLNERDYREWVFGTLGDRLSFVNWVLLWIKQSTMALGPLGFLMPVPIALAWLRGKGWSNPVNRTMLLLLAGYFVHAAVFIRLNLRHDYYVFGSAFFLIAALTAAIGVIQEASSSRLAGVLGVIVGLSMSVGAIGYIVLKRNYRDILADQTAAVLKHVEDPGAIVFLGYDWSPRIPFEVGRKALMIPDYPLALAAAPAAIDQNADQPIAAVVVLGRKFDAIADKAAKAFALDPNRKVFFWSDGYLLLKAGRTVSTQGIILPEIEALMEIAPPQVKTADGLVYRGARKRPSGETAIEVVVKRGRDAFCLRIDKLYAFRVRGYFSEEP